MLLTLNLNKIVQHVMEEIKSENTLALALVFDSLRPVRSTGDMMTWFTGKPCSPVTVKSHINFCVVDSGWEATEAYQVDRHAGVTAWAKNDHLGFDVYYVHGGVVLKYRPDFLIKLANGTTLVLEVKGQRTAQSEAKRRALDEWVEAVNQQGGFGHWAADVSFAPADVLDILEKHLS